MSKLLRCVVETLAIVSLLATAACAPAAAPAPTAAPAKPATAPAPTTASAKPAAAPAIEPGREAEWNKVVEAAKKEGKVTFYGAPDDAAMAAAAAKSLGIQVDFVGGRGNENRERIEAELRTGKVVADFFNTGPTSMNAIKKKGGFQPLGYLPNQQYYKDYLDPDGVLWPTQGISYGILINTNLVKPADEPKSWADLLDSKWKGKILADDPRAAGGANSWFVITSKDKRMGPEYHQKMAQHGIIFSRDYLESMNRVARGEYPMVIPLHQMDAWYSLRGTPTKALIPEEGMTYVVLVAGVPTGAPHPNAAKLLINWLMGEEGQKGIVAAKKPPLRWDLDYGFPKEIQRLIVGHPEGKLLGTQSAEDLERSSEWTDKAMAVYGK